MKHLLFICVLFANPAFGIDYAIILGSDHLNPEESYNETNPGFCASQVIIGCVYRNSFEDTSYLLGLTDTFGQVKGVIYGMTLAGVSGYDHQQIWFSFDFKWKHARISFIPGELVDSKNIIVYMIQL